VDAIGRLLAPARSIVLDPQWQSYLRLYFARLAGQAVGMVLTILSARVLHPDGRGEFVAVSTGVVLGVQGLNLGLSSSLLVLFSRRPPRVGRYRRHLVLLAGVVAGLLLGGVYAARTLGLGAVAYWWPAWAIWVPLQLLGLFQSAAMVSLQDSKALAAIELTGRGAGVVLGGTSLLVWGNSLPPFLSAVIAADGLVAVLGALRLSRVAPGRLLPARRAVPFLVASLRMGLRAYPPLVLGFLLIKSDILVLRALRSATETGIYSIASQLVDIALILPASINALLLPSVVRAAEPAAALLRIARQTALLTGGLALGMALFGHWAIGLLFGQAFLGSYPASSVSLSRAC
jgi:antigen flippase